MINEIKIKELRHKNDKLKLVLVCDYDALEDIMLFFIAKHNIKPYYKLSNSNYELMALFDNENDCIKFLIYAFDFQDFTDFL